MASVCPLAVAKWPQIMVTFGTGWETVSVLHVIYGIAAWLAAPTLAPALGSRAVPLTMVRLHLYHLGKVGQAEDTQGAHCKCQSKLSG